MKRISIVKLENCNLGPVYMWKNASPGRPGADRQGKFQSRFI